MLLMIPPPLNKLIIVGYYLGPGLPIFTQNSFIKIP